MPRRKTAFEEHGLTVGVSILSFAIGIILNAVILTEKIATKPYVDEKVSDTRRYTDESIVGAKQYTDLSHKSLEVLVQSAVSDVKADVKAMIVKQDLMFDMLKSNKNKNDISRSR